MKPLLFAFRRCPFAIRARLAIKVSGVEVQMQEVSLRAKPRELLECSPKGTVPVLKFADGRVLEQSLDIHALGLPKMILNTGWIAIDNIK